MCNKLDIRFGQCKEDAKAILIKQGIIEPTTAQPHAIIFMYKTYKSRYGRIIEEKENDVVEGKDTFPKTVAEACWVLGGWKNKYGNNDTRLNEANNRMAFAMTGNE